MTFLCMDCQMQGLRIGIHLPTHLLRAKSSSRLSPLSLLDPSSKKLLKSQHSPVIPATQESEAGGWRIFNVAGLHLKKSFNSKDQKSYVLPHMWTLDQGQTQQGDWTMST
jgi:hypothetical protein